MIDLSKVTNKIAAIKALRELPIKIHTQETSPMFHTVSIDLGLREAKELVEAIMAIQPQTFVVDGLNAKIKTLQEELRETENRLMLFRSNIQDSLDKSYQSKSISDYSDSYDDPKF